MELSTQASAQANLMWTAQSAGSLTTGWVTWSAGTARPPTSFFPAFTISAIAAKVTLESPLEGLLRVQPFLEFIDGDIASY